jgi:hypothetical protein
MSLMKPYVAAQFIQQEHPTHLDPEGSTADKGRFKKHKCPLAALPDFMFITTDEVTGKGR